MKSLCQIWNPYAATWMKLTLIVSLAKVSRKITDSIGFCLNRSAWLYSMKSCLRCGLRDSNCDQGQVDQDSVFGNNVNTNCFKISLTTGFKIDLMTRGIGNIVTLKIPQDQLRDMTAETINSKFFFCAFFCGQQS